MRAAVLIALALAGPVWATTYTLTFTSAHGTVYTDPNGLHGIPVTTFAAGKLVRFYALPSPGYCFDHWSGDVTGTNLVGGVLMNSNKAVTANFVTWHAPIGIPVPSFGITETYRMYDTVGNRAGGLTYNASPDAGYYTHYVDSTDKNATNTSNTYGSPATPRLSIPLNLPPGSVVEVHHSSLDNAQSEIHVRGTGTRQYPIFVRGVGMPRLEYGTGVNGPASFLVFEGISFRAGGAGTSALAENLDHIVFRNCDVWNDTGVGHFTLNAFNDGRNTDSVIYGCQVHDIGIWDPNLAREDYDEGGFAITGINLIRCWVIDSLTYHNSYSGIQCEGGDFIYAGRNVAHDNRQSGFWTKSTNDVIFSQNTAYNHCYSSTANQAGFGWQYDPNRVWIIFNTAFHNHEGIVAFSGLETGANECYILNNRVWNCRLSGLMISAQAKPVQFVNNTINHTGGPGIYYGFGTTVLNMANNIISDCGLSEQDYDEQFYNNGSGNLTLTGTNNLLSAPMKVLWGYHIPTTLAQWRIDSGLPLTDWVVADPCFVNTNLFIHDYHLQAGSAAIDAGTSSGDVATTYDRFYSLYGIDIRKDIEGKARPQDSAWDIGAYEYIVSAVSDLSVSSTSQNSVTLVWTVPGQQGVTGTPARYDIRYAGSSLAGANWDTATQVQGEPVAGSFGTQQSFTITGLNPGATCYFGIKVLDEVGHTSATSNVVSGTTATTGNHAPVLTPIGDRSVAENATLTFTVNATDADGDPLTYWTGTVLAGSSFNPATRTFTWTPTNLQGGWYRVMFQVSDTKVTVSETITITVREGANQAPELGAIGDKSVNENASLSFSLSATDPDGDSLTFSATGLPSGANLANGVFSWIPSYGQAGSYQVTFTVSDGELTDSEQITITVISVSDRTAPAAHDFYPAPDAIQVPLNPLIALTISDDGSGVDASTVAISVNNQLVYSGDSSLYESAYGVCRRTGTRASYRYYYRPAEAFDFSQQVSVYVTASDAVHNAMTPVFYRFVTEMRSFGRNQAVSSSGASSGHPAMATDSQGNIWATWHAGQANARDIYVAKRSSQAQQWAAPLQLTNLGSDQCNPAIAIGSDDTLYVVWQDNRRGNWDIYGCTSADGSTWQNAVRITDSNDNQTNPVIAADHAAPSHVYVAWEDDGAGNQDIYLASSNTAFAGKTITRVTSNPAAQTQPALAVASDNTVYLVWTDQRNGSADIYGSSSSVSSWANVPIVTGPGNQSNPAIAVEPGTSTLHVLWMDDAAGNLDVVHGASNGLPGSPISGTNIVDDATGADQLAPAIVAAKDHGNNTHVYACWQDNRSVRSAHDSDLYFVEIRSGTGGTNILVGDDGTNSNQSDPALGVDEYGQPAILWVDSRDSTPRIYNACSTYFKPIALTSALITRSAGGRVGTDPALIAGIVDVSIQVPPSACVCDTILSISEIRNPPKFTASCIAGCEIGPSGVQFSFPATVTIPYTNSGSGQATPYWYDPQTGTLSQEGMTEITNRALANGISVVSFKTTHLTAFYVLKSPVRGDGVSGGGGGCALSHSHEGSIVGYFLPYAALALFVFILRCRNRRHKGDSGNASSP